MRVHAQADLRTLAATAVLVGMGAAGVAASIAIDGAPALGPGTIAVLAICAAVAESQGSPLTRRVTVSPSIAVMVLAAVVAGPLGAAVVCAAAMLGDLQGPAQRWLAYTGLYAGMGAAGGFAALAVAPIGGPGLSTIALQVLAAGVAVWAVNVAGNAVVQVLRRIRPLSLHLRVAAVTAASGCFFGLPFVVGLAYGHARLGFAIILLSLMPLLAASALLRLYREKHELSERLKEGNMAFAMALVRALDARDPYTAGHSAAVAAYARDLARAAGFDGQDTAVIQLAALLHDVGKIGVPTEILSKPGPLDQVEWNEIRRHPEIGERITAEAPVFAEVARIIRHHHERPDGAGYPDGLAAGQIPAASAIIGLADAYSAMTQPRSYRPAMDPEAAIRELRRGAGSQFDPVLVELFVDILQSEERQYREALDQSFSIDAMRTAILVEMLDTRRLARVPEAVA